MKRRVLLIDNDADFLAGRKERLEEAGYIVRTAISLDEARDALRNNYVHLASVDVRMVDEDSEWDVSGLDLVREPEFSHIVKVVLTGRHFEVNDASLVMKVKADPQDLPDAVFYLTKEKGWQVMLDVFHNAIESYCHLKDNFVVHRPPGFVHGLVGRLDPDLPRELWLERGEELVDLISMACYSYDTVTIDRLVWYHDGRLALAITARKPHIVDEFLMLIDHRRDNHQNHLKEYHAVQDRAPDGHAQPVANSRPLRTLHYAGELYALPGVRLDQTVSLPQFFVQSRVNIVSDLFKRLVTFNLKPPRRTEMLLESEHADNQLRIHSKLTDATPSLLRRRIDELGELVARENIATMKTGKDNIVIRLLDGLTLDLRHPADWLEERGPHSFGKPLVMGDGYGAPPADTILVANDNSAWITDNSQQCYGPLLSGLAGLEVLVKLELHPYPNVRQFIEAERQLLKAINLTHQLVPLDAEMKKPFGAIQQIRNQAVDFGGDLEAYERALFYHAVQRLLSMPFDVPAYYNSVRIPPAQAPLYTCLSLGLLASHLAKAGGKLEMVEDEPLGIEMDEKSGGLWVEGRRVHLRGAPFRFLFYLYCHPRVRCSNEQIMADVMGGAINYDSNYPAVLARAIRKALGPNAGRYLENQRGSYVLYPDGRRDKPL